MQVLEAIWHRPADRITLRNMTDVTRLLEAIQQGQPQAADALLPLVYDELRKLAAAKLVQEKPGQTLQATALVHEAYLRLVGDREKGKADQFWNGRGHFFAAAAEAMRRILIEQARRKRALKAGGERQRLDAEQIAELADEPSTEALDILALDEALKKLERKNPRQAELIKLRYFAGLTLQEAADAMGLAVSTVSADWVYAKSWLRLEMQAVSE
jgi:RNA polymerase sigma factor (TIGR02999 family)